MLRYVTRATGHHGSGWGGQKLFMHSVILTGRNGGNHGTWKQMDLTFRSMASDFCRSKLLAVKRDTWSGLGQQTGCPGTRFPYQGQLLSVNVPADSHITPHVEASMRTFTEGFWSTTTPEKQVKVKGRWGQYHNFRVKRVLP